MQQIIGFPLIILKNHKNSDLFSSVELEKLQQVSIKKIKVYIILRIKVNFLVFQYFSAIIAFFALILTQ